MKIWIDGMVYARSPVGGIRRYFDELLARLPQMDSTAELFVTEASLGSVGVHDKIHVVPVFSSFQSAVTHPARTLRSLLKRARFYRKGPDIFHASYYTKSPFPKSRNVVTVYDFVDAHHPELHPNGSAFLAQQRSAIEAADCVLAISECTRRDVLKFTDTPPERVRTIKLAAGDIFRTTQVSSEARHLLRDTLCQGNPYWLFVGRRGSYKNFTRALQAYAALASSMTSHLVICGPDEPWASEHQALLDKHDLKSRVHLLGAVSDQRLVELYAASQLMVYPSLSEGFGIPLLEAMACGTPLACSDIPVFREVAGSAAEYFNPLCSDDMAAALRRAAEPRRSAELIQQGAARITRWPSWNDVARDTLSVYQQLLT